MTTGNPRLPAYVLVSDEEAQHYVEETQKGHYSLSPAEMFWKDRQPALENHGYSLRPRYRPGWTPSWIGTNFDPTFCEDSIMPLYYQIMDATRQKDNVRVIIKRVPRDGDEICISLFLSSPDLILLPNNHCVPLLDVLPDPFDISASLIIMPYLRPFNDPEFGAIGEVVDFIKQTLEGLQFLHSQRVAHRDCAAANIMMDGRPLYPNGHHPLRRNHTVDGIFEIPPLSRIDHPVKYYFIDFDLSRHFPEGTAPSVLGRVGRDKEVPELSSDTPYDAFKVDVYALANLYDKEFLQKYLGLDFLQPLIDDMKNVDPARRPSADRALAKFMEIYSRLNSALLRWRLRSRTESTPERVVYDTTLTICSYSPFAAVITVLLPSQTAASRILLLDSLKNWLL
ncbi:hypothetical protein A0H81_10164 [Grifola frondosa]|uniref:Protein kinase domain-containing protein n=1 Tax=Grifola frondosa TaxID=5627 RepID=A0A1C7LXR9_GRIFR|nr:hypothetical protein A0H81_10164 [Grifola frondosa]